MPTSSSSPNPVTWRGLLLSALLLFLALCAATAGALWWGWQHLSARVTLGPQQAVIELPQELDVRAAVDNAVRVKIDQELPVRVPIRQTLSIPITDPIPLQVSVDTTVPIDIVVPVEHVLHIDQSFDIDTTVKARVLGIPVNVPIQGKVPLKADVPVSLKIPVKRELPVSLKTAATVRLTEPLNPRIDTVIEARIPVRETLSLPVTAPVDARLRFPRQQVQAGLAAMQVDLPLQAVELRRRDPSAPGAVTVPVDAPAASAAARAASGGR